MTPAAAIEAGIAYLPGERLREGCFAELTLSENVTLPVLSRFFRSGRLRLQALRAHSVDLCARFDVRPADPGLPLQTLSGGNQQKVLLAKWLQLRPRLLILQEPTQGVDVGAREQIFAIIRACAAEGGAVLCLSSDHEQLATLCRRALVFRQGRISAELAGPDVSKERMAYECFGTDFAARQDAR
jgi:ribose transport system ATP-binding protein